VAGKLYAVALPDADVAAKLERQNPQPDPLLKPGTKISVEFDSSDSPPAGTDLKSFENNVRKHIADFYRPYAIDVAEGQPLKLQYHWKLIRTGTMINKPIRVGGRRQNVLIPEIKIDIGAAILRDGEKVWSIQSLASSNFGQPLMTSREQLEEFLTQQRWRLVVNTFLRIKPPVHVFAPGADQGLGTSSFPADAKVQ